MCCPNKYYRPCLTDGNRANAPVAVKSHVTSGGQNNGPGSSDNYSHHSVQIGQDVTLPGVWVDARVVSIGVVQSVGDAEHSM